MYYICLMDLPTIAARVNYAEEIHESTQLSDMIQRSLKKFRAQEIADYLSTQRERLFNALVVATYGGEHNWHAISKVNSSKGHPDELTGLGDRTLATMGFLTLRGDEILFALDGQHRLAGIKTALEKTMCKEPFDQVAVIFVAHDKDPVGLERTRRLFTTLNKTAKAVSKGDIIALDEDDVMAIVVRWLVDREGQLFHNKRIAFVPTNNLPQNDTSSLTTIGNLYDILTIFFTLAATDLRKKKPELQRLRPPDSVLDKYFQFAVNIFLLMRQHFEELDEFFSAEDTARVVQRYRVEDGGNALFRPLGLDLFSTVIARLSKEMSLEDAFELAAKLPRELQFPPYAGLMWNPVRNTISNRHKVTMRELLLHMLRKPSPSFTKAKLLERYRKELGDNEAQLPEPVV